MAPTISGSLNNRLNKEKPSSGNAWKLLIFLSFILSVFIVSYLGLIFGYKKFVQAQIFGKEKEIAELAEQVPKEQQEEYLKFQYQIINLQKLLKDHVFGSKVFNLLEANTNPQVRYTGLTFDATQNQVNLQAIARSYEVLAQQLAAYEKMPEVLRYQFSNSRITEGGSVQFDVSVIFDSKNFRL